jgi:GAF domain-containing protein
MLEINKIEGTREQKYKDVIAIIRSIVKNETDKTANMANIAAVIKESFDFHWVGFYRVVGEELTHSIFNK